MPEMDGILRGDHLDEKGPVRSDRTSVCRAQPPRRGDILRPPIGAYARRCGSSSIRTSRSRARQRIERWAPSAQFRKKSRATSNRKCRARRNLALADFVHSAGGWSHEIYLFYANWNEDGRAMRQGFCLRKDPGAGLLRELSSLHEQFRVIKALEATAAPTPKAYWYEEDPSLLGGPFFVMEKVEGEVPNPWSRAGKQFYAEAAERGKLPHSFVEALAVAAQSRLARRRPRLHRRAGGGKRFRRCARSRSGNR